MTVDPITILLKSCDLYITLFIFYIIIIAFFSASVHSVVLNESNCYVVVQG